MAKIEMLKTVVNERLTAAAEEILWVFGRTIIQYEEEIDRQRKLLNLVFEPETKSRRSDPPRLSVCEEEVPPEQQERSPSLGQEEPESSFAACYLKDAPQLPVCEEEVPPEQQEWSTGLGQEEPEPPQTEEEQQKLQTSRGGEQLRGLEEADVIKLTFTPVPVKRESDEEKPQCSQRNQTETEGNREADPLPGTSTEHAKTEPDGEDCGALEPVCNFDPACGFEPASNGLLLSSDYSETETCDSDDWKETRKPKSGLNALKSKKIQNVKGQSLSISSKFKRSMESSHEQKSSNPFPSTPCFNVGGNSSPNTIPLIGHVEVHSSDFDLCGKHFEPPRSLETHLQAYRTCNVCGERLTSIEALEIHLRTHTEEEPFSCLYCGKIFDRKEILNRHLRIHTGEKPFICSFCHEAFGQRGHLKIHMRVHTGEKPFSCTVCGKRFSQSGTLVTHMRSHTGEKPFGCTVCGKRFSQSGSLAAHMRSHTGEKPFACTVCNKRFSQSGSLATHMRCHTGEKPFGCSICCKRFGQKVHLQTHMRLHREDSGDADLPTCTYFA